MMLYGTYLSLCSSTASDSLSVYGNVQLRLPAKYLFVSHGRINFIQVYNNMRVCK